MVCIEHCPHARRSHDILVCVCVSLCIHILYNAEYMSRHIHVTHIKHSAWHTEVLQACPVFSTPSLIDSPFPP